MKATVWKKAVTMMVAGIATLAMAGTGALSASAAQQPTLTLTSTTDLTDRTFEAWEPILIDNTATSSSADSYQLSMNTGYEEAVKAAAVDAKLTVDGSKAITAESSSADVLQAISYLGGAEKESDVDANNVYRTFADSLLKQIEAKSIESTVKSDAFVLSDDKLSVKASLPSTGFYLVKETTAADPASPSTKENNSPVSLVISTPVSKNVTVELKSSTPESHKNIVDVAENGTISHQHKADTAHENTAVHYELTFYIPSSWASQYTYKGFWFTMNDTISKGLTFDKVDSVKVGDDFAPSASDADFSTYTTPEMQVSGQSLSMNFGDPTAADTTNNMKNLELAGKWVKVYYTAHLNDSAVIASTGNDNDYDVTYQHDPQSATGGEKTPKEHAYLYSFQIVMNKVDGNSNEKLANATFSVLTKQGDTSSALKFNADPAAKNHYDYNPEGTLTEVSTDAEGNLVFEGLKEGTYYLHEVNAPQGYNRLGADVQVEVKATNKDQKDELARQDMPTPYEIHYTVNNVDAGSVTVKNYKGFLPRTGGFGIAVLVVAGIALVAGGVMMLARKRA